jgi:hypothetical protein
MVTRMRLNVTFVHVLPVLYPTPAFSVLCRWGQSTCRQRTLSHGYHYKHMDCQVKRLEGKGWDEQHEGDQEELMHRTYFRGQIIEEIVGLANSSAALTRTLWFCPAHTRNDFCSRAKVTDLRRWRLTPLDWNRRKKTPPTSPSSCYATPPPPNHRSSVHFPPFV